MKLIFSHQRFLLISLTLASALSSVACAHHQTATVLPKGGQDYEIVAQGYNERTAFSNAESEAKYTCENQKLTLVVHDSESIYQGANKDERDDVDGGNVALAVFTGSSGKERQSDDYKVKLLIGCI
jgi:hypothetical protein